MPKVITKEIWGKIYGKENVKIPLPDGMDVNKWGKTRFDMKKFAGSLELLMSRQLLCRTRAMSP